MKTAISIPDVVFESAEQLAQRLGESRSELYSKAVKQYVAQHQDTAVTTKLNQVYDAESSAVDETLSQLQTNSLAQTTPW